MKFRISLFLLIFLHLITESIAKPRCDIFYENVYNQTEFPRDVDLYSNGEEKEIGIKLLNIWDEENKDWKLAKNKEGYYIVGKVNKESLLTKDPYDYEKILIGDIVIEVNDKDIRQSYDESKYGTYISDMFDYNEKVKIKFLRILPNKENIYFDLNLENESFSYNKPFLDILFKNISVNDIAGTYTISLKTDFTEFLGPEYKITEMAHKYLVNKLNSNEYPSEKDIIEYNWSYEECPFDEKKWGDTQSRDPAYGLIFRNQISEEKNQRYAKYLIIPYFEFDEEDNPIKYSQVTYERDTIFEIKNDFNLKTFPFDKQKLVFQLTNARYLFDEWKAQPTTWTQQSGENLKKENSITGWNIANFKMTYNSYYDFTTGHTDGFDIVFEIERKSKYYLFKIILPIVLILIVCWSSILIDPRELESRLTITIVCLLSLIAYNFVIDSELPKLDYLTVMDYIILVSYVYATIPNFLSILSFNLLKNKKKKVLAQRLEYIEVRYGLLSYLIIILSIIIIASNTNPEYSSQALTWVSAK